MIELFRRIQLVEVWFDTADDRRICLPRITMPEPEHQVIRQQVKWTSAKQPRQNGYPGFGAHSIPGIRSTEGHGIHSDAAIRCAADGYLTAWKTSRLNCFQVRRMMPE